MGNQGLQKNTRFFDYKRNDPPFLEKKIIKKKYNHRKFESLWMETQRYHLSDFEALVGFNIWVHYAERRET